MNTVWPLLIALAGFVVSVAVGDLVSEEIRGRLDALPRGVLLLAVRRLPEGLRAERLAEWEGELHEILRGAEALPVTRLWLGLRYAAGVVRAAPSVARAFSAEDRMSGRGRDARELVRSGVRIARSAAVGALAVAFVGYFILLAIMTVIFFAKGEVESVMIPLVIVAAACSFLVAVSTFVLTVREAAARAAAWAVGLAIAAPVAAVYYWVSIDSNSDAYDYIFGVGGYLVGFTVGGCAVAWVARRTRAAVRARRLRERLDATRLPGRQVPR